MTYPNQLPEKPEGWTRSLICHFNYGADGGSATYSVKTRTAKRCLLSMGTTPGSRPSKGSSSPEKKRL